MREHLGMDWWQKLAIYIGPPLLLAVIIIWRGLQSDHPSRPKTTEKGATRAAPPLSEGEEKISASPRSLGDPTGFGAHEQRVSMSSPEPPMSRNDFTVPRLSATVPDMDTNPAQVPQSRQELLAQLAKNRRESLAASERGISAL
jgi:hypothetical protein